MERSIADIIAEHEEAHARTDALEDRPGVEESREELALFDAEAAEDDLMFKLVGAPCASDDEFFIKAAYILKSGTTINGWRHVHGFAHIALAEALRQHLKRRETLKT